MARAYLALGTNLGDRHAHLRRALGFLGAAEGMRLLRVSTILETAPVGPPQPDYLNAVAEIETSLSPRELLAAIKGYERDAGREGGLRWGPRIIDLDILVLGEVVLDEDGLTIPHKELARRAFVLQPLNELAPGLVIPGLGRTVAELWHALEEEGRAGE